MKFDPKAILAKQGWSEGQGLGRNNQGNKDPIKVTYKFDKTGLGHDFGKDYDAHSAFSLPCDNILQNLKVVPTEDGGVKLVAEVSKQKPEKPSSVGNFVKSTRLNNGELADTSSGNSSDSDSETENVSTTKKYTDEELFKICGGMTGYGAEKFGISKAAKLARIREQDELAAKNALSQKEKKCVKNKLEELNIIQDKNVSQESKPKKHKKHKHSEVQENNEDKKFPDDATAEVVQATNFDDVEPKKKKSKKRKKSKVDDQEVSEVPKKKSNHVADDNSPVNATESSENTIKSKKRKRDHDCDLPETEVPAKKSKSSEEVQIENQEDKPKKKKSKQSKESEELQNATEETCDDSKPKKIKKKKVAEEHEVSTEAVERDATKPKKNKKSK